MKYAGIKNNRICYQFVFWRLTVNTSEGKVWNGYTLKEGDVYGREQDGTFVIFHKPVVWPDEPNDMLYLDCTYRWDDSSEWRSESMYIGTWSNIYVDHVYNRGRFCPRYFSGKKEPDYERLYNSLEEYGLNAVDTAKLGCLINFRHMYGDIPVLYPYYHRKLIASGAVSSWESVFCPEDGSRITIGDPTYLADRDAEDTREKKEV